jgi:flavin reductase (DIM6/NTAB) family NADH-FMN oxidoreductase RutF
MFRERARAPFAEHFRFSLYGFSLSPLPSPMHLSPATLSPNDRYKLLIGAIVPRPIAWVSTRSPDGRDNLAPFSFFAGVGSDPMTLLFCPATRPDGTEKDSLRNAKPVGEGGTGEFVVNVVPHELVRRMAACAEELAYGESEFALAGLTPAACEVVRVARVLESPVSFECRTMQVIRTNPTSTGQSQPGSGNIVLGEVVQVHVRDELINERMHIDAAKLDAIGRMGGSEYCTTRERFGEPRGRAALS